MGDRPSAFRPPYDQSAIPTGAAGLCRLLNSVDLLVWPTRTTVRVIIGVIMGRWCWTRPWHPVMSRLLSPRRVSW